MQLVLRLGVLFGAGVVLSSVITTLHQQHELTQFPPSTTSSWIPLTCGSSAVLIGLLFPMADQVYGNEVENEWATVMRCLLGFAGIAYAAAKFEERSAEMSIALGVMATFLWKLCDGSKLGFGLALMVSVLGTLCTQAFVYNGLYSYKEPDFFLVRSWIPCLLFAAALAFGCLGRQLAVS